MMSITFMRGGHCHATAVPLNILADGRALRKQEFQTALIIGEEEFPIRENG